MRIAAPGCAGAGERLAGQRLPHDAEGERVVVARAPGLRALERVSVHRGTIESRHVERRDHVARQHASARGLDAHDFVPEPHRVRIDPRERDAHLASLAEAVHANVTCGRPFPVHLVPWGGHSRAHSSVGRGMPQDEGSNADSLRRVQASDTVTLQWPWPGW